MYFTFYNVSLYFAISKVSKKLLLEYVFNERRLIFKKYTPSTDGNILDPFCDKYDLLNDKTQFLGFLK